MLPRPITITTSDLGYRCPNSETPVIADVNLRAEEGDFIALVGLLGCGKITLLRCLTGLIPQASEGEMRGGNPALMADATRSDQSSVQLASSI